MRLMTPDIVNIIAVEDSIKHGTVGPGYNIPNHQRRALFPSPFTSHFASCHHIPSHSAENWIGVSFTDDHTQIPLSLLHF